MTDMLINSPRYVAALYMRDGDMHHGGRGGDSQELRAVAVQNHYVRLQPLKNISRSQQRKSGNTQHRGVPAPLDMHGDTRRNRHMVAPKKRGELVYLVERP